MTDMLTLTAHLPATTFAAGDIIIREGDRAGAIWILLAGTLHVRKGDVLVNVITHPGAVVGEISVLLNSDYGATVAAAEPCVMRYAADGRALLADNPTVTTHVAIGLAERLNFVTTYLVDLKHQYGDAPGLAMIPEVLRQLAACQSAPARTGSNRDPNPEY